MGADFYAIIPAGGSGSRLWPLSRASAPKFLHDLTGNGRSLLGNTWDRLSLFAAPENIAVVTGATHEAAVRSELPELFPGRLLIEPSPKDSATAIAFAVATILDINPNAVIGSFAADHVVGNDDLFLEAIFSAREEAENGYVVAIGVRPTEPSTAFGYIRAGVDALSAGPSRSFPVSEFVEKPDYDTAKSYLSMGSFFWNAGMFVCQASVLWELIEQNRPVLAEKILQYVSAQRDGLTEHALEIWDSIPAEAIDYVVAEPAAAQGKMRMVVAEFLWDDVGDFASLSKIHQSAEHGSVAVLGANAKVVSENATGVVVSQSRRVISLIGVKDIVIVDTPDALLVTTKEHAQDVKKMVEHMKLEGLEDVL